MPCPPAPKVDNRLDLWPNVADHAPLEKDREREREREGCPPRVRNPEAGLCFLSFFTLATGPRRSLGDASVYAPPKYEPLKYEPIITPGYWHPGKLSLVIFSRQQWNLC